MSETPAPYITTGNQLSAHFTRDELKCHHCGELRLHPALLMALEELRERTGTPILVNSCYRCHEHNAEVNGRPRSQHLEGRAADIRTLVHSPMQLARHAEQVELFRQGGIGTYLTRGFVHVDIREELNDDFTVRIPNAVRWTEF